MIENLISVIVPIYKVEEYLDRCVQSIVGQTYGNLEIILVDDGSPDNCPDMCDEWAKRDSRIKVIHKENGGLSDARNAGMAAASGEYIGFIDSDDWIEKEMYERLISALKKDNSDICACAVKMVFEDDTPDSFLVKAEPCVLDNKEAQLELLVEHKLKQPVWYKLYRRETAIGIDFEKGKYHEDNYWSYQAVAKAKRVSIIDYVGYYYWQRSGSIMGEGYSLKRLDAMGAYCNRYEFFKEQYPDLAGKALASLWGNCIYHAQMSMKYLDKADCKKSLDYLKEIQKEYPIKRADYKYKKLSNRLWFDISRISLRLVCRIKSCFNIGI